MEEKFVPKFEVNSKPVSQSEPPKVVPEKVKESDKKEHGGLTVNCDKPVNEDEPVKKTAETGPAAKEAEPVKPDETEKATLFSLKTDTYHAWVTQNGDNWYQSNLELAGGSTYFWPAGSPEEAEQLLAYHIRNQKL